MADQPLHMRSDAELEAALRLDELGNEELAFQARIPVL